MTLEEFPLFNLLEESEKDWYKFLVTTFTFLLHRRRGKGSAAGGGWERVA